MQASEDELATGRSDRATADQQETLDDLEQARLETASERRDAEERLAREVLKRMEGQLAVMIARQSALIAETKRLEKEPRSFGRWNRKQLKALRDHALGQRELRDEVLELAKAIESARVFSVALRVAAGWMTQADLRLSAREVDAETTTLQESAKSRLEELAEAMKLPDAPLEKTPDGTGGNTAGPKQPERLDASFLSQLKLLRSLQRDVRSATEQASSADKTENQAAVLEELANQQGELANLLNELLEQMVRQSNPHRPLPGDKLP